MNYKKTNTLKILIIALLPLLFFGCDDLFDDGKITYDGPTQVEFFPLSQSFTLPASTSGATDVDVQLIGEQRSEAVNLTFSVVPNESGVTQAQGGGVHYTLPASNAITIAGGSSIATFSIDITGANLAAGEQVQLSLELQVDSGQNVQAAENLKTYVLTLTGGG